MSLRLIASLQNDQLSTVLGNKRSSL